jgi:hypothetical protein
MCREDTNTPRVSLRSQGRDGFQNTCQATFPMSSES